MQEQSGKKKIAYFTVGIAVILILAGCLFMGIRIAGDTYIAEVAGYYLLPLAGNDTEEDLLNKTIVITDRNDVTFDGRTWKITRVSNENTKLWLKATDGSGETCWFLFSVDKDSDIREIFVGDYDRQTEVRGIFYEYITEKAYSAQLESISSGKDTVTEEEVLEEVE